MTVLVIVVALRSTAGAPAGASRSHSAPKVPRQRRGPLAWDNAKAEGIAPRDGPIRLVVHHVNERTNQEYISEARAFLLEVWRRRLPFSTPEEVDLTMAMELDRRCYLLSQPVGRGQKMLHGWCHIFHQFRGRLPLALRALHTWEDLGGSAEGQPASRVSVHAMAIQLGRDGHIDACIAAELSFDGYRTGTSCAVAR